MIKLIKFIHRKISSIINCVRSWLNSIRSKKPETFDSTFKVITFFIPFVSWFAPALVTNNWLRAILEFVVLTAVLVFQWSTLTNRVIEKDNKLKEATDQIQEYISKIERLERDTNDYSDWLGEDEQKYKKQS